LDAIDCQGLSKDFGEGRGILDLDLRVPEGIVFGFLGPNGAGKTTTLRLLMGFLKPDRGDAHILGLPLETDRRELHRHIGYVPGELALPGGERVQTYLDRCAAIQGVEDPERQRWLVEQLDVPTGMRIRELSKGNRQKVALVQALQHEPRLLVLDEPTDGLDPILRRRIGDLLRSHAADGGTVFLSSHVVHEIETVCDQVAIVVAGRLRSQAHVSDLLRELPLRFRVSVPGPAKERVRTVLRRHGGTRLQDLGGDRLRLEVRGDPLPLLADLAQAGARDALFEDKDLEETFMHLYEGQREAGA
jgi:ABC-2 type transport system ATP-binding protein